jgi:hypothetical protein
VFLFHILVGDEVQSSWIQANSPLAPARMYCVTTPMGPVLASRAPSPPAAAAAAWRGLGRVPIAGWSLGGVGPVWVFGGEKKGV